MLRTLPTLRRSGLPFVSLSHSPSQSSLELPSRAEFEDLHRARHVTLRGEACLPTHRLNLTSRFKCFRVISPHRRIASVIGSTSYFVVPNRTTKPHEGADALFLPGSGTDACRVKLTAAPPPPFLSHLWQNHRSYRQQGHPCCSSSTASNVT